MYRVVHQHVSGQTVRHTLAPQQGPNRPSGEGGREEPAYVCNPGSELRLTAGEGETIRVKIIKGMDFFLTMSLFTSAHSHVSGATQVPLL